MPKKYLFVFLLFFLFVSLMIQESCTHDPFIPDMIDENPIDTMMIDTMVVDTTIVSEPCDSTIIYFNTDIQPILNGSCAFSGCHDASTASDGVILDNYENVINTAEVVPFDLGDSELYEAITENDPDDVMPPSGKLDNELISIIAEWILQGAENIECNEDCNLTDVTYNGFVKEVFSISCNACHSSSVALGGVILDNYEDVSVEVDNGYLLGAINWDAGFEPMPQGQAQLDSCTISKIKKWIDEGAENN